MADGCGGWTMSGSCGCGCGEAVSRRYRPGHDAKHKASLTADTRSRNWWVRERAVAELVERGWGRFIDQAILASTPVRSRYRGRFCETRHVNTLHGVVLDDEGTGHSVWFCPAAVNRPGSNGRWVKGEAGWLCSACIHTQDWSERVNRPEYGLTANAVDQPRYVPAHPKRRIPKVKTNLVSDEAWWELDLARFGIVEEAA